MLLASGVGRHHDAVRHVDPPAALETVAGDQLTLDPLFLLVEERHLEAQVLAPQGEVLEFESVAPVELEDNLAVRRARLR